MISRCLILIVFSVLFFLSCKKDVNEKIDKNNYKSDKIIIYQDSLLKKDIHLSDKPKYTFMFSNDSIKQELYLYDESFKNKINFNLYAGADNVLDETYSLGNDINAAAGRYYNAAPRRNFYFGISFQWNHFAKR